MDGREKTVRQKKAVLPVDSIEQLAKLEEQWCAQATQWVPPQNAVVRPLAEGRLFFLVFFSGHRRDGDLIQYLEWTDALITPIPIDLAIDGTWGNALDCNLWAELIVARKVLGCHCGPPCETYSDARWLEMEEAAVRRLPRPLRSWFHGWGMPCRSFKEAQQTFTGSRLMMVSITYLLLIYLYGGCGSLEHPRGKAPYKDHWSVWCSSLIRRLTQSVDWQTLSFLQGPLGVPYAKPTRLLCMRLPTMPKQIFGRYQKGWKATETLGGKEDSGSWKTAKAKVYPPKLCKALTEAYLDFWSSCETAGSTDQPDLLENALNALTGFWDPYVETTKGNMMAQDYHG